MPQVKTLDRKRKDYLAEKRSLYAALYEGGHRIEDKARDILPKRPAESQSLWDARIKLFHYLNRVAKIIDEFAGSVFGGEIQVLLAKDGDNRPEVPEAYVEFVADPKGDGDHALEDVLFEAFRQAQIHRDYFLMPTFPEGTGRDRGDQEAMGLLTPALRCIGADTVINLNRDARGLAWVMLRARIEDDTALRDDEDRKDTIRWTLIDRKQIRWWEIQVEPGKSPALDDEVPEIGAESHRWAEARDGLGICPVVHLSLDGSTWLLDKIASMAVEETRKRNGLSWLEELACYPWPYHAGESTIDEKRKEATGTNTARGAAYWLEIGEKDKVGYLEPGGESFAHLSSRLEQMGHEIAEVVHQAASALGPKASAQVQSAASKVRDSVSKRLLAETYAADIRKAARQLMDLVAIGRGESLYWEVIGLDVHDIADSDAVVNEGLKVQAIDIPSETFYREHRKRMALALLPNASPEIRDKVTSEIDKAKLVQDDGVEE